MIRLVVVFYGFLAFFVPLSLSAQTATDPFVVQMQIQSVRNNINALSAENESLKIERDALLEKLKRKKTGAAVAIGAAVVGTGIGVWGVSKGIKAKQNLKAAEAELNQKEQQK